jgi:hypothetical protein
LNISGYHADFHEGYGTFGEWQGRGMAWQGNGMGTALAQHGMGELALNVIEGCKTFKKSASDSLFYARLHEFPSPALIVSSSVFLTFINYIFASEIA